jgi:hypothetical protein
MRSLTTILAVTAALTLTAGTLAPAPALAGGHRAQVTGGHVQNLQPGGTIRGGAIMVRTGSEANGRTVVVVHARGLAANTTYPVHVHNAPCSATPPGGGHYQHVVGGPVDAVNEIWPAITTNARGNGTGFASHAHRARPEAQAIIVHNPADTSIRLVCVDLR